MGHKFNYGFKKTSNQMKPFRDCSDHVEVQGGDIKTCVSKYLSQTRVCPIRFGVDLEESERCRMLLHNTTFLKQMGSSEEISNVAAYKNCVGSIQNKLTLLYR